MSDVRRRLIERILDPSYTEGLAARDVDDLKGMRNECREAENELSFERRLCQARIEILRAELDRRLGGDDAGDLISRLPHILAGDSARPESPLPPRAPDFSIPRSADVPRRRVEEIIGEQTIARLPQLSEEEIKRVVAALESYEKTVSARRRKVQQVFDGVQDEIVRRFASGEADPTSALG